MMYKSKTFHNLFSVLMTDNVYIVDGGFSSLILVQNVTCVPATFSISKLFEEISIIQKGVSDGYNVFWRQFGWVVLGEKLDCFSNHSRMVVHAQVQLEVEICIIDEKLDRKRRSAWNES